MISRTDFLPPNTADGDYPVAFGEEQTVPTEMMATLMVQLLPYGGKVLEVGTGSGYTTALLAERSAEVLSLEVQHPKTDIASKLPDHVTLIWGVDGCTFDSDETFDGILVTFAAQRIHEVWFKQLKEGGILVVPVQLPGGVCRLCQYQKLNGRLEMQDIAAWAPFTEEVRGN